MPGKTIAIQELLNMEANLTGFLIFTGCGALLCILWFFLALRKKTGSGKAALISSLSLALGVLLGVACARTVYVLCMLQYRYPLLDISYDQLSYYGGMAGVILAVCIAGKAGGLKVRETLNVFAPMGALLAAAVRFAEYFLSEFGVGDWMEEEIFFPVTVRIGDEEFADFYLAVFMLEGLFAVIAMILALVHRDEKYRWVRTLFYLCLPQVLCESLRMNSIAWRFVRAEMLFCFLWCEGVLVWYAFMGDRKKFSSWVPALTGLLVCGLVIVLEFVKDGKILISGEMVPHWIVYAVMALGLAAMAFAEHKGYKRIQK